MALWDYHSPRGGPSFVGLTDERLAVVRAQHPGGRVIESVHHLPRQPGDDETDHILRQRYGIDPNSYRGSYVPTRPRSRSTGKTKPSAVRSSTRSSKKPRAKAPPFKVSLSRLVSVGLSEAPDSGVTVTRLVQKHLASGKASTRHSLFGLPLIISSRGKTVRVAFAMERKTR